MDERINSAILTLYLIGKAAEKLLAMAVYVRFYLNKVKDKQEKLVLHTYPLIKGKSFMEVTNETKRRLTFLDDRL